MALTTAQIQAAYVTFFNRPADVAGLNYWSNYTGSDVDLYNTFAQSAEYTSLFAGQNNTATVNTIYGNLLGRTPDVAGLNYWVSQLDTGALSIGTIANAIKTGAQGTDATTVANKTTAATTFTAALDTAAEITGYASPSVGSLAAVKTWLAAVTTDATLATQIASAALTTITTTVTTGAAATGSTFTLTTGIDNLTGTSGDDTFIGEAASASNGDQVNGGSGTDTMKIYDAVGVTDIPTLTSIETLELNGITTTTDLSALSSVTSVIFDNATTAQTFTVASGVATTMKNMADGEAITITNAAAATSATATVDGMGTTATVAVAEDGAALATINLAATGTASFVALTSTGTVTTVNLTGDKALTLDLTGETSVSTLAASAFTGALTSDLGASANNTTVTTGSGADAITATAAVNYTINLGAGNDTLTTADAAGETTTDDTLNGGDGTDTLAIASAEALNLDDGTAADIAVLAKITNFEQLRITNAVGGDFNIGALGYNYLQVTTAIGADRTITGFTSGMTLETRLAAAQGVGFDYIIGMTGATDAGTNSDTINIKLNADLTANDTSYTSTYDLEGINIVNISANDRTTTSNPDTDADGQEGYVVDLAGATAGHSANITTVNISGAAQVSYTVNAATTALTTVEAGTATGNVIADATLFAGTQGVTINGGAGIDTLTGSTLGDIISGGAGVDTITGLGGADTLTGGAAADIFVIAAADAAMTGAGVGKDTITDFNTGGSDVLRFAAADGVANAGGAAVATASVTVAAGGKVTFASADDTLTEMITTLVADAAIAANEVVFFELGSDTYVYGAGANADGTDDFLVKLTGITGKATLTESTVTAGDFTLA